MPAGLHPSCWVPAKQWKRLLKLKRTWLKICAIFKKACRVGGSSELRTFRAFGDAFKKTDHRLLKGWEKNRFSTGLYESACSLRESGLMWFAIDIIRLFLKMSVTACIAINIRDLKFEGNFPGGKVQSNFPQNRQISNNALFGRFMQIIVLLFCPKGDIVTPNFIARWITFLVKWLFKVRSTEIDFDRWILRSVCFSATNFVLNLF